MDTSLDNIRVDLGTMLKASAREENGERVIYCEAANENRDQQGERILQKALEDSREYFLSRGVIDLDHRTLVGHKQGIANPYQYEIGRPTEVRCLPGATLVKGILYKGNQLADFVWKSMTEWNPAKRWFPSVGGAITDKADGMIRRVRWNNLAFTSEPVNHTVGEFSIVPFGEFAKSFIGSSAVNDDGATPPVVVKGLEAGYGTNLADLTGGAALREESLHGAHRESDSAKYEHFARSIFADLSKRNRLTCGHLDPVSRAGLQAHAEKCIGLPASDAAGFTTRLLAAQSGQRAA